MVQMQVEPLTKEPSDMTGETNRNRTDRNHHNRLTSFDVDFFREAVGPGFQVPGRPERIIELGAEARRR